MSGYAMILKLIGRFGINRMIEAVWTPGLNRHENDEMMHWFLYVRSNLNSILNSAELN
jgi:hypothetical protein